MPRAGEGYADRMATAFIASVGASPEDGLSGGENCRTPGLEPGCERKWRGGANGMDKRVSVLQGEGRGVVTPLFSFSALVYTDKNRIFQQLKMNPASYPIFQISQNC